MADEKKPWEKYASASADTVVTEPEPVVVQEKKPWEKYAEETVKKKEPSGDVSQTPSETPSTPSGKSGGNEWEAIGQAVESIAPASKPLYDFGRRIVSGIADDVPKSIAQSVEVGRTYLRPSNVKEFIHTQKPIDFQKYVRKREGLAWYKPFSEEQFIDKYADDFMREAGYADKIPTLQAREKETIQRRVDIEQYVQQQNVESEQKMAGSVQDFRDIKSLSDLGSYIGTMGGQAAYQIPLSVLTKGQSSLLQESAAIYDNQLSELAKKNKISREEVIKKGLDDPARGQAYAVLAASLDAASAGNIISALKEGAKDGLLKRWLKTVIPEAITEPAQSVLEEVGGAAPEDRAAKFVEAITSPDRINDILGGIIGGSAGAVGPSQSEKAKAVTQGLSPRETTQVATADVNVHDQQELDAKAEVIQEKVNDQESALSMGAPDAKPITDEATTVDTTTAIVKEEQQQPGVSEDQAEEETPETGEAEVTVVATVHQTAKDAGVDINTKQFADMSEDLTGERHLDNMTAEQLKVIDDHIKRTASPQESVQYEDRPTVETGEAKTQYAQDNADQNGVQETTTDDGGVATTSDQNIGTEQQAPGQTEVQLQQDVPPAEQPASQESPQVQIQNVKKAAIRKEIDALIDSKDLARDEKGKITVLTPHGGRELRRIVDENKIPYKTSQPDAVQERSTTEVPVGERAGGSQEVGTRDAEGNQVTTEGQGQQAPIQDQQQSDTGTVQQPNVQQQPIDDSSNQRGVSAEVEGPPEGNGLPPNSPPKTPERSGKEPVREPQQRKTWLAIKDDPNVSNEIKEGISKEAKEYVPRSLRKVTQHEADVIIDWLGNDLAKKMYLDDNTGIHHDVDTALGIRLFERFQDEGNYADAIEVFEKLARKGTELGQAVNAYKLLKGKTMLFVVDRALKKNRRKYKDMNESVGTEAKATVDKINQDAVEQVLSSEPVTKAKKSRAASVKKAIDFLDTLKIDTKGKALDVTFGITAAAWNTVITTVQKGLQAGLTITQAIDKAVKTVKDPNFKKKEAIEYLDEKLASFRVTLDPDKAIRAELKAQGQSVDDIIRSHYKEQASTRSNLIEKLVKDGNVAPEQAQEIADAIAAKFDELTRAAKTRALEKIVPKERKVSKKKRKEVIDKLVELSNMGALSEEKYLDIIAKEIGVPDLTAEQAKDIRGLTDVLQTSIGDQQKSKRGQDLYNYIEGLKGWSWWDVAESVWFANMLSGPTTWLVTNPFANATNLVSEASIDIARNPKHAGFILSRIASGLTRGLIQAGDVLRTGYDPYKGENYKTEATPLLERVTFKGGKVNPVNWLKYVTRAIKAGDVIFYQGLKAQRFAVAALNEARNNGRVKPNAQDLNTLYGQLMQSNYKGALAQAESEGFKGREAKLRAYEIMEEKLPEMTIKEAENFAARATFNYKPEGALGGVANWLNTGRRDIPLMKVVVPFVNTIINVANEYLNYNPVVGGWRYFSESMGVNKESQTYRKLTKEESARIGIKAIIGTVAIAALAALDDEDDDSLIEITANGTGDIKKNYELQRKGWRPYSVRIGDTWYSYKNTPIAMPMASVGFWKDASRYGSGADSMATKSEIMAVGTFKMFMEMSTLSGLADFFELMQKDSIADMQKGAAGVFKYLERSFKALVIPNYFTQMSRLIQEFTESPIKKAPGIGQSIYRDMPVLRDNLDNLYDAFGDPVTPKQLERFLPFNAARSPEDKEMFTFLQDHKLFVESVGRGNLKPNGEPMSDEEFNKFALASAQRVKKRLMKEYKSKTREKNAEKVKDWFQKVKREERKAAKIKLFGEN